MTKTKGSKGLADYSVLITVYKGDNPEFLRESLNSIFSQTLMTDDVVLVKDGEIPDLLQNVIDEFKEKYPNVINEISIEKNKGLGSALNVGLKECKNPLVARMDADDISVPERCELQVKAFKENLELDICGAPVLEFKDSIDNVLSIRDVPKSHQEILRFAKRRSPFNHPVVMYKKDTVLSVGGYSDLRKCQDLDLWIRLLQNGAIGLNLDKPLLYFRFDESTYIKRKSKIHVKTFISIYKRARKSGFCSYKDYLITTMAQRLVRLLPISFQKYLYKKHLRKKDKTKNG